MSPSRCILEFTPLVAGYENVVIQRNQDHVRVLIYKVDVERMIDNVFGAGSHTRGIPRNVHLSMTDAIALTGNKEPVMDLQTFASLLPRSRKNSIAFRNSYDCTVHGDNSQIHANNKFLQKAFMAIDFDVVRDGEGDMQRARARVSKVLETVNYVFAKHPAARARARLLAERRYTPALYAELQATLNTHDDA